MPDANGRQHPRGMHAHVLIFDRRTCECEEPERRQHARQHGVEREGAHQQHVDELREQPAVSLKFSHLVGTGSERRASRGSDAARLNICPWSATGGEADLRRGGRQSVQDEQVEDLRWQMRVRAFRESGVERLYMLQGGKGVGEGEGGPSTCSASSCTLP